MDSLTAFKLIHQETKRREEGLTEAEKINRLFEPAVCGSQAWLERSKTWEMKQAQKEREKEEEMEKREKAREIEKELERERENQKRRIK